MFDWELILDKLRLVKKYATEDAPAAARRLADALNEFEKAVRKAADWLGSLDGGPGQTIMSAEESMALEKLERFALECEQEAALPNERRVRDDGPDTRDWTVLLPIVMEFIRWVAERRRRPQP